MNSFERLQHQCEAGHKQLAAKGLLRTLGAVLPPNVTDFSSNDYLGLKNLPQLAEAAFLKTKECGVGSGASRVVVQTNFCINELEQSAASWLGWPRVLYFASGFNANMALFEAIAQLENVATFLDVRAHASLFIGGRASQAPVTFFKHGYYAQLEKKLMASSAAHKFVFVESLHSMDGTFENADALAAVCQKTGALLVIDEAHSAGIYGHNGKGWASAYDFLRPHTLAVMFGCGKAVGVSGGLIAAPSFFIDQIINTAKTFIYSTAPSPLVCAAVKEAILFLQSDEGERRRQKLRENINVATTLQHKFQFAKLVVTPHSPILYFQLETEQHAIDAASALQNMGLFVKAMRPPTVPRGTARLRIVLKASHTHQQIEQLFNALTRFA